MQGASKTPPKTAAHAVLGDESAEKFRERQDARKTGDAQGADGERGPKAGGAPAAGAHSRWGGAGTVAAPGSALSLHVP